MRQIIKETVLFEEIAYLLVDLLGSLAGFLVVFLLYVGNMLILTAVAVFLLGIGLLSYALAGWRLALTLSAAFRGHLLDNLNY